MKLFAQINVRNIFFYFPK